MGICVLKRGRWKVESPGKEVGAGDNGTTPD
jgi:hypothetical protein